MKEIFTSVFENLSSWGLPLFLFLLGIAEFIAGRYDKHDWDENEKATDLICYAAPKILLTPVFAFFSLKALPVLFPGMMGIFSWVPFWFGFAIIAVADDLTQYWYHRLHHEIPWLWRFHRTHHSASYMGMAMASRQNVIYTVFFSQTYVTATLVFLGLGFPALFVKVLKSFITISAHSSIPWDKPFYKYRILNPIAWVLERLISTPATHHAHHADANDGVGHYKGNFGNMFFIWDMIFGTGLITRQYPAGYGVKHYFKEEWYVQFLWPFFKSKKAGSELAVGGPEFYDEVGETGGYTVKELKSKLPEPVLHDELLEEPQYNQIAV
ncbi:sterol desaturase [Sporocytophaga myxococcoides]|uniref:Sterol desaturase n=1 Tax=Sporocytophaga myxococcoides TaxID=153721 RepID=A0A098LBD2_9BACT|nr:sterol desaturase family protein [Sporocytophaga myxococcoides]GAL83588.1 sterol desaturase [Sporocytophaga myxococcoides]